MFERRDVGGTRRCARREGAWGIRRHGAANLRLGKDTVAFAAWQEKRRCTQRESEHSASGWRFARARQNGRMFLKGRDWGHDDFTAARYAPSDPHRLRYGFGICSCPIAGMKVRLRAVYPSDGGSTAHLSTHGDHWYYPLLLRTWLFAPLPTPHARDTSPPRALPTICREEWFGGSLRS